MVELGDIIDLIWVDGGKPIYIITEEGEPLEYGDSDITDELESTVDGINVYDSCVEISLGEWVMNKVKTFSEESFYGLGRTINEFAEKHEIINVSLTTFETRMGTSDYKALVLYKV